MNRTPSADSPATRWRALVVVLLLVLVPAISWAGDWPAYRRDAARSASTDESLELPLRLAWSYRAAQAPAPAWGEQLHLLNRVDFDYAPHPVIAGGIVCFASTADDTVRALDEASGAEKWHFTAGGPIRVPPQIDSGKVYFGSDDGAAYCLDARDGRLVWSFRGAPADERLVGNHRMISRWPIRSGVLVIDGMAYFVAGLWNSEGVFVYGLDAQTGREIWCNDTAGFGGMGMCDFIGMGINGHHQGEFGMGGQSPQGPMVGDDRVILIPTGFSGAFALDRRTGKSPRASAAKRNPAKDKEPGGGAAGTGGTWLTIDSGKIYSFAKHGQGGNVLGIQDRDLETGKAGRGFMGPQYIPQLEIGPDLRPTDIHERGKVNAVVHGGRLYARKAMGIALAGKTLVLGDRDTVWAENAGARETADVRFAMAGEDVAVFARVVDGTIKRGAAPWKGSCVEIFGAMPGKAPIGQVFLLPATGKEPAQALYNHDGKPAAAPEIRIACKTTKEGYELSALIPASLLSLDAKAAEVRLEAQVTVSGADSTLQRGTLYGSESAYQDSSKFGAFKFKPVAAMESVEKVAAALKATKPGTIWLQGLSELWREKVDGEAREIAIADGRIYVGTSTGVVYCFAPASGVAGKPVVHDPGAAIRASTQRRATPSADSSVESRTLAALKASRIDRGFALVLGDTDGRVSLALAENTRLRVVTALTDARAVGEVRERVLTQTNSYGARIHVQKVDRLDQLPFAQFFANAVIVAGAAEGCAGSELYRVLHPCGGVLMLPGMERDKAEVLLKSAGAAESEIQLNDAGEARITRGKLPGALDWDSPKTQAADQRVKWPLRPLWFGGPSTTQVLNYRQGADGPTLANGRYFIKSETTLSAVDAYNGSILWSRSIPKQWIDIREANGVLHTVVDPAGYGKQDCARVLYVNNDAVFLALGNAYTRGKGMTYIELDARTGDQLRISGAYNPPKPVVLNKAQSWPVALDDLHSGVVALERGEQGLTITLTTKDPKASKLDGWDLFFDFRPTENRYGLYDRGAFQYRIRAAGENTAPPELTRGNGPAHPDAEITGQRDAQGTRTTVTLKWSELEKLAGGKPRSFGFAATLQSHDGGRGEPIVRRHLFGDWTSDAINNGWALIALDDDAASAADAVPAIIAGANLKGRPAGGGPRTPRELAKDVATAPRFHPLTGEPEPKVFRPSTLCGGAMFSDQVMTGRAGVYDFADDSGMRFLGGVKTRCTTPQDIALGIVLISEETGHCSCNYPMRTSLALAPAERRLNEDWAMFHDRDADTQLLHAAINLGAPGDRRDDAGKLWLGYPRPPADKGMGYSLLAGTLSNVTAKGVWPRFTSSGIQLPLEVKSFDGPHAYHPEADTVTHYGWSTSWVPNREQSAFGPYRVNADRAAVRNTNRPWLYASSFRGIQSAKLRLNYLSPIAAPACTAAPAMNGKVDGPVWAGDPQVTLPFTSTRVYFRQDATNLYIAARRPAVINRLGAVAPWAKSTTGEDASVWADDSLEVFLGERTNDAAIASRGKVLHLGVSASGARYDALAPGNADDKHEDSAWNGQWTSAVSADDAGLGFELTIPWKTIESAGLNKDRMGINVQMNQKDVTGEESKYPGNVGRNYAPRGTTAEAMCNLGPIGRERCVNFAPIGINVAPAIAARRFTVRLHFAELDDVQPGQRVFDVSIQGRAVIKGLDVVREAGGPRAALTKEFHHIEAADALLIEFTTAAKEPDGGNAPILSALEVYDEATPLAAR